MLYSVQIYNNCEILFQITYTLYIKPYMFCTGVYSYRGNVTYFTVSRRFGLDFLGVRNVCGRG